VILTRRRNDSRGVLWFHEGNCTDLSFGLGGHETETVRLLSTKVRDPRRPHGLSMQKGNPQRQTERMAGGPRDDTVSGSRGGK
jgi:hypothetical protein